jgi:hypothetical protein
MILLPNLFDLCFSLLGVEVEDGFDCVEDCEIHPDGFSRSHLETRNGRNASNYKLSLLKVLVGLKKWR